MAELAGPKIGDARSLWNFTPSPGWSRDEAHALRLCLKKFGVGKWIQIVDSGVLPGKQIQQLNGQTQRLLGQQSLAEYSGMCVDIDAIRADNNAKQGSEIYRKSGLITNQGGKLGKDALKALREANFAKYGLSQEEVDAIALPEPPRSMKLGADAYMGKNHNKGGIAGVKRAVFKRKREADVLTVDVETLSRPAKLLLLAALRKRLIQLRTGDTAGMAAAAAAAADDTDAKNAATDDLEASRVLKEKQNDVAAAGESGAATAAKTNGGAAKKDGAAAGGAGKKSAAAKLAAAKKGRSGGGKKRAGKGAVSADEDTEEENAAPPAPAARARCGVAAADNDAVQQLVAMGFDTKKAKDAVRETGGDVMEAVNWLVANCA